MAFVQCAGRACGATRALRPVVPRTGVVTAPASNRAAPRWHLCAVQTPARAIVARQCSTVASGGDAGALTRKQNRLPVDHDGAALTLIQYPICPFCCTARAYLDFHGVPYRVLDVNPITKAGLHNHPAVKVAVERGLKYNSVPVAVLPATDPISGSLEIINHLEALGAATTERTAQAEESIEWAYNHFVKLFPVNIYRSPSEAWEVFSYISDTDLSVADKVKIRIGGAGLMWAVSKLKIKRKLGVKDERQALYDAGREWAQRAGISDVASSDPAAPSTTGAAPADAAAGSDATSGAVLTASGDLAEATGAADTPAAAQEAAAQAPRRFHGGAEPDLADIVVWGMLNAMSGMRTLADLRMEVVALDKWFTAMQVRMTSAAVVEAVHAEGASSDDEVTHT